MASHPINLALRFFLELAAWGAMGYWGWTAHEGVLRLVLGFGLPLVAMTIWGVFRVPDDPGQPPVSVRGSVRLMIEAVEFGAGAGLLYAAGQTRPAILFGVIVLLHYAASYDRIRWLLTER